MADRTPRVIVRRAGQNRAKIWKTSIPVMLEAVRTLHSQVQLRGGKRQKHPFTEGLSGGQIFQVASSTPGVPGCPFGAQFRHIWVPGRSFPAHLGPWEVISGTSGSLGALWDVRGVTFRVPGATFGGRWSTLCGTRSTSGALSDCHGYLWTRFSPTRVLLGPSMGSAECAEHLNNL